MRGTPPLDNLEVILSSSVESIHPILKTSRTQLSGSLKMWGGSKRKLMCLKKIVLS